MDYVKLGEQLVYVTIPIAGIIILIIYLRKEAKGNKKNKLITNLIKGNFKTEDELSWFVAHDVMGAAGYQDCVVYKVDQADQVCRQIAAFGPKNPDKQSILNPINIPFGRGIVGHVAASGKSEWIADTSKDPRYVPDDDVRYSELTVPVILNGSVAMVIDSEHKNHSWFKEDDVKFVHQVAHYTAEHLQKLKTT
jgi:signal transduction protein with GAF and PtsI domain